MNKACAKCQSQFTIAPEDIAFYKKIDVTQPSHCPRCRMQRLMSFRNERTLFKRKCDFSGKEILSVYPPNAKVTVYDQKVWWSDDWDALSYGKEFDFFRPFFDQYQELYEKVPRINLDNTNNENSEYCNDCDCLKNCYLNFNSSKGEDLHYFNTGGYSKDCMDMFWAIQCELCYECTKTLESYHCFWCFNCANDSDCYFCNECFSCKNCFGCVGLRQKEYHIFNEKVGKEEFEKFIKSFEFTYQNIQDTFKKVAELSLKVPHKNLEIMQSENCLGDYISNSKNCQYCFDIMASQDLKYVADAILNDSYDCFNCGSLPAAELMYHCVGGYNSNSLKFCFRSDFSHNLAYCDTCSNCHDCIGCISLRYKSYCILNKQYTKEEYFQLLEKIKEHMIKTKESGKFFPARISAVAYNDSVAQYHMPLTRDQALQQGFNWNDYENPKLNLESIEAKTLPGDINEVTDDILKKSIRCEKDGKHFRIISPELNFYRKHGLALPHLCPDCRHYARKAKINPRVLVDDKCAKCGVELKTTYPPEHAEKINCKKCYLEEVY